MNPTSFVDKPKPPTNFNGNDIVEVSSGVLRKTGNNESKVMVWLHARLANASCMQVMTY